MKKWAASILMVLLLAGCHKNDAPTAAAGCNMAAIYAANEKELTVNAGIWGTLASMEGDCMPMVGPTPTTTPRCTTCPVRRTLRFYAYTLRSQAIPIEHSLSFYENFSTPLLAEVETDEDGFFQLQLPAGVYSVAILENGKLYASGMDGQGGLNRWSMGAGC